MPKNIMIIIKQLRNKEEKVSHISNKIFHLLHTKVGKKENKFLIHIFLSKRGIIIIKNIMNPLMAKDFLALMNL
jgi:hypothetical protein